MDYQQRLGERLRAIRVQQGLTLQEVEEKSGGRWKAVVVGSYERGDRAISVSKLARLARFYGVPVSELLPSAPQSEPTEAAGPSRGIALDLTRLDEEGVDPQFRAVARFAQTIQIERGDFNGRVLTLRTDDLRALAILSGASTDEFVERLEESGLLTHA
ncbi:MAG: transcriptional regulator [Actinomycetota bacterium]|nr:transcriptional regulator [Actinomycetota bacterium]